MAFSPTIYSKDASIIVARIVNACWYVFKLTLGIALIGGLAIGVYMYARMDDEIRRHIERVLAERYPHLNVRVGGARIVDGRGIAVYELAISDPRASLGEPLVAVDEMMLVCDVELASLVQGECDIRRVEVKHPRAFLRRAASGSWNVLSLWPSRPCGGPFPHVVIRDGVVSIHDDAHAQAPPLVLREINCGIKPAGTAPPDELPPLTVDGALGGPQLKTAEFHATLGGGSASMLAVKLEKLQINDAILAWAMPMLPASLRTARVAGLVDGNLKLTWAPTLAGPPSASASLSLSDGRIDDPRLPQPLSDVCGVATVENDQLSISDLHGRCGMASIALSLNRSGWAVSAPIALRARAEHVLLDDSLYRAIAAAARRPEPGAQNAALLQEQWDKYKPSGTVDATLEAGFDGQRWTTAARLAGRQLSFESDKYAYRLTGGAGSLEFLPADAQRPPMLTVNIVAHGGGQPLRIEGLVVDPKPHAAGKITITGQDVEIDQRMIDALPPKPRQFIASLRPAGRFNVHWQIERVRPGDEPQASMRLDLTDVRINYDKFPFPLRRIQGSIVGQDDVWTFRDLATAGQPVVRGEGSLRPVDDGSELTLRITGEQVPLDKSLFEALPPGVQSAWRELDPWGEIDLTADVFYRTGQSKPNILASIRPRPESTQIRPAFFPYLMERLSGAISYRDGEVSLVDVKAHHGATTIRTSGGGFFSPDGPWQVRLAGLTVDRLNPNQELLLALQHRARPLVKIIDKLKPTGSFSLSNGVVSFRKAGPADAPLESEWDVQLDCIGASVDCGIVLEDAAGAVRLKGRTDAQRSYSAGELTLDTATFQDVQFTNVRGPIWVDETRCLLGHWATDAQQQPTRRLAANVYGGSMTADAWVTFETLPRYSAQAEFSAVDLDRVVAERMGSTQRFGGKVDADVTVNGAGYRLESLVGEGNVHIREADIGELQLLSRLLKMLKARAPDKTAFKQCEIAFQLQGRHINLPRVDFLGDAVNLYGQGKTSFDQDLTLAFSPDIGRSDRYFPLVKSLVGQANQQIMQIYVTGTLSNPVVSREPFPGLNQMLKQIRADLEDPMGAAAQFQARRSGSAH